jgi:uncharacterized protein YjdB
MRPTISLLLVSLACACGGDDGVAALLLPNVPTVALSSSSSAPMTSAGHTRLISAVVTDANRLVVQSPLHTWSSSTPAVASVTGSGATATVNALSDGSATITATLDSVGGARGTSNVHASLVVTVHRIVASVTVSSASPTIPFGGTVQIAAAAFDARHVPIAKATDSPSHRAIPSRRSSRQLA